MDLALIRTFLEVSASGSFVAASQRLYVTQSAVSLRIQRLEDQLGHPLFERSKAGAVLTQAGKQFEGYALALLRSWEEARQQVAIPEGFSRSLTIGAQVSLWPRLGFRLIDRLQAELPDLSVRAELAMPDQLLRAMTEGVMQLALTYSPTLRPGLSIDRILDEELVLVASWPAATVEELAPHYVYVEWGSDFLHFHNLHLPGLTNPGLTLRMGAMAARFIMNRRAAGFLPARYAKRYLDAGRLHLIEGVPSYTYPVWAVWRDDIPEELASVAKRTLDEVSGEASEMTEDVLADL